jgi:hypothetical protein
MKIKPRKDLFLVIFASLGILGLLIRSIYLLISTILTFRHGNIDYMASNLSGSLGMFFCAVLILPMLILSYRALKGRAILPMVTSPIKLWQLIGLLSIWVITLVLGSVISNTFKYGWVASVILILPGISIPILVISWICIGGLTIGSTRRLWSVFGIGMIGSTLGAVIVEYLLVGIALLILGIVAILNPTLLNLLNQIKERIGSARSMDIQNLVSLLAPYLTNPIIILSIFFFAAVLAPVIEEAFKPAVIWLLGKDLRSTGAGFAMGALCGAGFATMEGLLSISAGSQMWGFAQAGRAVASLMHIAASSILGWGIASAQLKKQYGRLALTYLIAISIHGAWNGAAVLAVYGSLRMVAQNIQFDLVGGFFIMIGLAILLFLLIVLGVSLPLFNHRLRLSGLLNNSTAASQSVGETQENPPGSI